MNVSNSGLSELIRWAIDERIKLFAALGQIEDGYNPMN